MGSGSGAGLFFDATRAHYEAGPDPGGGGRARGVWAVAPFDCSAFDHNSALQGLRRLSSRFAGESRRAQCVLLLSSAAEALDADSMKRLLLAGCGWLFFSGWCLTGSIGCNYGAAVAFVSVFFVKE